MAGATARRRRPHRTSARRRWWLGAAGSTLTRRLYDNAHPVGIADANGHSRGDELTARHDVENVVAEARFAARAQHRRRGSDSADDERRIGELMTRFRERRPTWNRSS